MVAGKLKYEPVEARGRDPGFDQRTDQIKRFGGQRSGLAHRREVFRPMQADLPAAAPNFFVREHKCRRRRHQRSLGPGSRNCHTYALLRAEDKSPIRDWEKSAGLADFSGVHVSLARGRGGF